MSPVSVFRIPSLPFLNLPGFRVVKGKHDDRDADVGRNGSGRGIPAVWGLPRISEGVPVRILGPPRRGVSPPMHGVGPAGIDDS